MENKDTQRGLIMSAVIGAVIASFFTYGMVATNKPDTDELKKDFYTSENAVLVSPHGLRKKMDKGETDYILVDVRSQEEYEKEHIVGAINIPAYKDPNISVSLSSDVDQKDRIINSFKELDEDKQIIVYCYSTPCMTGRKVGKLLVENDIYPNLLGIGWNEWRYGWDMWNHDGETPVEQKDYIVSGVESGTPKLKDTISPCVEGELGC